MRYHEIHTFLGWIDRGKGNFSLNPTRRVLLRTAADRLTVFFIFVAGITGVMALTAVTTAYAQTFSGQATAVKSTVTVVGQPVVTNAVADTGPLPSAGGLIQLTSAGVTVPKVLTVGSSNVTTQGSGTGTQSTASVNNVNIGVLDNTITVDLVSSSTNCNCPSGECTPSFVITNLEVNKVAVVITGEANQTINLPGGVGTLVINEQILSPGSITVNALHLFVTAPLDLTTTDVIIASAHSDITCFILPSVNRYSGRSTDVRLTQTDTLLGTVVGTLIADTGFLPRSGGSISVTTTGAGAAPPLLTTGVVTAATSGGLPGGDVNTSQSNANVNNLGVNALDAVTINTSVLNSDTQCACILSVPNCSGDSLVTNLVVTALGLPVPIIITGQPNQLVTLPAGLGTIIINEQSSAGPGDITVNALHVNLNVVGLAATEIIIASAHSDIVCATGPTAGEASISGRVMNSAGRGIGRATVVLTDMAGITRTRITNPFGYYRFTAVPSGLSYTAEATHKQYTFAPQIITVHEDIMGVDFISEERGPD